MKLAPHIFGVSFVAFTIWVPSIRADQDLAQELAAKWGQSATPSVHFELKETERKKSSDGTQIAYHLETSGFPEGKSYSLWMRQSGDRKTFPVLGGYSAANPTGTLDCATEARDANATSKIEEERGKAPESPAAASEESKLRCMSLKEFQFIVNRYHKGEPLQVALVST